MWVILISMFEKHCVLCVAGGSSYEKEVALPHRPRILLLYPRDCEPFMNMMATFRQVLKEVTACQVRAYVMCFEV